MADCFAGRRLYGDDFTRDAIALWYEDEREAYADLGKELNWFDDYFYHAMNVRNCYSALPHGRTFDRALGFGSALGDEFLPIIERVRDVVILEPSEQFVGSRIGAIEPRYVKPTVEGIIPFPDAHFDLITCFGVLHHIPNVSFVIREMARVARSGGFIILREPVVSMGDWRHPRPGLTRRERGIPAAVFRSAIDGAGLRVARSTHCMFRPAMRVRMIARRYNTRFGAALDAWLSRLFAWNNIYHPTRIWQKFRPAAMSFVLTKD